MECRIRNPACEQHYIQLPIDLSVSVQTGKLLRLIRRDVVVEDSDGQDWQSGEEIPPGLNKTLEVRRSGECIPKIEDEQDHDQGYVLIKRVKDCPGNPLVVHASVPQK